MTVSDSTLTMAPLRTSQQRQEGLGHAVRAEEIDGEMLFDYGTIAEVIVKRYTGVVDEDVERLDALDRCLNLCSVGHVQGHGRDALVRVGQGLARTGVHPLRASLKASSTSACPIPRLAPVTRTVLSAIVIRTSFVVPTWIVRTVNGIDTATSEKWALTDRPVRPRTATSSARCDVHDAPLVRPG